MLDQKNHEKYISDHQFNQGILLEAEISSSQFSQKTGLNSFWEKFAQQSILCQTYLTSEPKVFFSYLSQLLTQIWNTTRSVASSLPT